MAKIDFDFDKELKRLAQKEQTKTVKPTSKASKKNTFVIIGIIFVVIALLFLFSRLKTTGQSNTAQTKQTTQDTQTNTIVTETMGQQEIKATDTNTTTALIKTLRIIPTNPTITDSIKAVVEFNNSEDSRNVVLKYQWFINNTNQIIGADTDTLQPGKVKKGDYVNVRVMAFRDDKLIHQVNSDMYMIVNSSPALSMKVLSNRVKKGQAIEIQLSATDPDGDTVTYSLDEAPTGMSIDSSTGKILFNPDKSGKFTFRASVIDNGGAKTTGTFEIQVNID